MLLFLFFLLRLYPIWGGNFPFNYDNAKDSLVIMQMGVFGKPALLGAATSLPGLWQGPFWYYVFFPLNLLFSYHPFASVLTVIFLGALTLYLFYRYLGLLEATIYTVSFLFVSSEQTAWSPYLTIFATAWSLIILTLIKKKPKTVHLVLLALCGSTLFHSEIAFGVVFVSLLILTLFMKKVRPTAKQIFLSVLSFFAPFVPQVVFEFRHGFLQTNAVVRFVTNFSQESSFIQGNTVGFARLWEVGEYLGENFLNSISPVFINLSTLPSVVIVLAFLISIFKIKTKKDRAILVNSMPFVLGSFLFYLLLPVKSFYLAGLAPFWIYLVAFLVRKVKQVRLFVVVFIVWGIFEMFSSKARYDELSNVDRILFAPKLMAVNTVYEMAQGRPFSSYQYVPEVYDYTYQLIYQYASLKEKRQVPVEYTYLPGEISYMQTEKIKREGSTAGTFLITEKVMSDQFFDSWWEKITRGRKIGEEKKINNVISVYRLENENHE